MNLRMIGRYAVALPALALFTILACRVMQGGTIVFDRPLQDWLHGHAGGALDRVMVAASWLGSVWAMVPAVSLLAWLARRQPWGAAYCVLANGGAALLNLMAKHGIQRLRPSAWVPLVHETTYSFPSGHAMQSAALAIAWLVVLRGRQPVAMQAAAACGYVLAVGVSRVYVGVHYPSDVLAGWCASLFWCAALAMMLHGPLPKKAGGDR